MFHARWLKFIFLVYLIEAAPALAIEPQTDCNGDPALVSQTFETVGLGELFMEVGDWALPISASHPDVPSKARVHLELARASMIENWSAILHFSFADPVHPLGIPFSFQKIVLKWQSPSGPKSVELDWANSCRDTGRSLLPGQGWTAHLSLDETREYQSFKQLSFEVFGSRN